MDEFFQQLPQPPSTLSVPSSNQVVCIICKHPAEKEENMEICSDVSCLAHAHQACGQFDNGRFVTAAHWSQDPTTSPKSECYTYWYVLGWEGNKGLFPSPGE